MTESVWDYPRPPRVEPSDERVVVEHGGVVLVDTTQSLRVLETSHPPTWYLPSADVGTCVLVRSSDPGSLCEWKGTATYWDVVTGDPSVDADLRASGWSYESPTARFADLAGAVTFYPSRLVCTVDGERVRPQDGGFYGGWITDDVVGPFKGVPGSWGW